MEHREDLDTEEPEAKVTVDPYVGLQHRSG